MSPLDNTEAKWLQSIDKKLSIIETKLEVFADHETRIRELEKKSYQTAVVISIITALITAVVTAFFTKGM
jgi:hypothetical protein